MEIKLNPRRRENTLLSAILVVFRRIVALVLIAFALNYWTRIIGVSPLDDVRFDTMAEHWQAASAVLGVLFPIAAIGLWGLFSWGTSIWLISTAIELWLYLGLPELFGEAPQIVWFHLSALATYVTIKLLMIIDRRRRVLPLR